MVFKLIKDKFFIHFNLVCIRVIARTGFLNYSLDGNYEKLRGCCFDFMLVICGLRD